MTDYSKENQKQVANMSQRAETVCFARNVVQPWIRESWWFRGTMMMTQFPSHPHPTLGWGKSLSLYNLPWTLDQDFNLDVSQVFVWAKQNCRSCCCLGAGEGENRSVLTQVLLMCEITAASEKISWTEPQTSPALFRGLERRPEISLPTVNLW